MGQNSGTKWIWVTFLILLVITAVEVGLGIIKPVSLVDIKVLSFSLLNWTFLILTILKAYYIVWYFMHVKDESKGLRSSITLPLYFLIPYLTFIILTEATYVNSVVG